MRSRGVVLVVVAGLAVASGPVAGRSSGAPAATRTAAALPSGFDADGSQFFYQGGGGLGSTAEAGDLVAASVG